MGDADSRGEADSVDQSLLFSFILHRSAGAAGACATGSSACGGFGGGGGGGGKLETPKGAKDHPTESHLFRNSKLILESFFVFSHYCLGCGGGGE